MSWEEEFEIPERSVEMPDIPSKCQGCPAMILCEERLDNQQRSKDMLLVLGEQVMDGMPEDVRRDFSEHLQADHAMDLAENGTTAEQLISEIDSSNRRAVGELIEGCDGQIDEVRQKIEDMIETCPDGKLTARAHRNGTDYLMTTCTSEAVLGSSDAFYPTRIVRE